MLILSKKYDLIITSRFLKKGSISDWPAIRRLITILRHFLIKLFLNINYDASGAFRCIDTKKIKIDDLTASKSNSYTYFWETIYLLNKKKITIKEIPVKLYFRKIGSSKMKIRDIFYSLYYLIKLTLSNK
jgi:dolichol-phosphate mannosyltransferase